MWKMALSKIGILVVGSIVVCGLYVYFIHDDFRRYSSRVERVRDENGGLCPEDILQYHQVRSTPGVPRRSIFERIRQSSLSSLKRLNRGKRSE